MACRPHTTWPDPVDRLYHIPHGPTPSIGSNRNVVRGHKAQSNCPAPRCEALYAFSFQLVGLFCVDAVLRSPRNRIDHHNALAS